MHSEDDLLLNAAKTEAPAVVATHSRTESIWYLGVTLDNYLSSDEHYTFVVQACNPQSHPSVDLWIPITVITSRAQSSGPHWTTVRPFFIEY